jgi:peptidoglycan/xylan/chitin deacetylase (PgdA/CDA1 family)
MPTMKPFFQILGRITKAPTLHAFYHIVTDEETPHISSLYPIRSTQQFKDDLDWILRHFSPITLDELVTKEQFSRPVFHLSFDDGLRQCSDTIKPILLEKGIPATFFINPDFVDNKQLMYRYIASLIAQKRPDLKHKVLALGHNETGALIELSEKNDIDIQRFLEQYKPYMTIAQIHDLANFGFTVGAHSLNHPMYAKVDMEEQLKQTTQSIQYVREKFEVSNPPFAFPFTDFGVKSSFFDHLPPETISFGCAGLKQERQKGHFQRLAIEKSNKGAGAIITAAYWTYFGKMILGRHIARR